MLQSKPAPGELKVRNREAAENLRIGGLLPFTMLDYPDALAATVYCRGCPWRCHYCHNPHLFPARAAGDLSWSEVYAWLLTRRGLLEAVVFSGGEPTAQRALPAALAATQALGFTTGLHTSGAYPRRLAQALPWVDWVGIDIKALPEDYPRVTGVPDSGRRAWASLALVLAAGVAYEVRTTPLPGWDDAATLERLMARLAAAGVRHYALQQCRPARAWKTHLPAATTLAAVSLAVPETFVTFTRRSA